jgi:hypothetical protein
VVEQVETKIKVVLLAALVEEQDTLVQEAVRALQGKVLLVVLQVVPEVAVAVELQVLVKQVVVTEAV